LKQVGVAAGAAGLAPAVSSPFASIALAQTKTIKIIQWSHFVPQYDKWFDGFAAEWGKKNGITVTVDHIPHLSYHARAARFLREPDMTFLPTVDRAARICTKNMPLISAVVSEVEKKHGKIHQIGRQIAYNEVRRSGAPFRPTTSGSPAFTERTYGTRSG
jgi:multiple sugar transport system substrate-binding protein